MFKKLTRIHSVFLTLFVVGFFVCAYAYVSPGSPAGYVNDFASIIEDGVQSALEVKLSELEASTSHEVVVVTIPTLGGDYIENYAVKLFEEWGIGKANADNGVLLLVAVQEREVRIEVGYGLEGALVDSEVNTIIQERIIPAFKKGDYGQGVSLGVDGIIEATQGEVVPTTVPVEPVNWEEILFFIIFAFVWGVNIVIHLFAHTKSWWLGGVLGGGAGFLITFFGFFGVGLTFGIVLSVFLALLGLGVDYFLSKHGVAILKYLGDRRGGGGWSSGGGFGGSSGGFGGFGGGGSGGGGASGRW